MDTQRFRLPFFFALLFGVLLLTFLIFRPYIITIAVASTFAVVMQPVHQEFLRLLKGWRGLSAFATVLLSLILLLVPLVFISVQVVHEARTMYEVLTTGPSLPASLASLLDAVQGYIPQDVPLDRYATQALSWIASNLGSVFSGTVRTVIHLFLGIIAYFYLLKDGGRFLRHLVALSPLSDFHDQTILRRLESAINSIVKGSLFIALIQGVLSGIGLKIFGVPSAALWGSMAAIGALIPGIGTSIVLAPAVIYLFVTGQTVQAIGLTIWGATAVGLIDNMIGPLLVGRGVRIHPIFVLFAVIGGISFFGPVGFILGPLVLSLLYALIDIYRLIILGQHEAPAASSR